MSLVNDSLKFQMAVLQIHCNATDFHIFSTKNNSVFAYVVGIFYLTISALNDDVKLYKNLNN